MKSFFYLIIVSLLAISCNGVDSEFQWSKDQIGPLSKNHTVADLKEIFKNDSIVQDTLTKSYGLGIKEIFIYDKSGTHLLTLTPYENDDEKAKIEYVQIIDPRYTTEEGISISSSLGEISEAYKISAVDNMLEEVQVRIADQNFYFSIDKTQLSERIRNDVFAEIKPHQLPKSAYGKHFFISW